MSRSKADWGAAFDRVPWVDSGDLFRERMTDNPEVLYRIIADAYDVALRDEEKRKGVQRQGRRPKPPPVPLRDVYEAVFPQQYSMDPFSDALVKLMDGQSQREFARRVPCHQTTLSRLLRGEIEPDMSMMERVADAAGVKPWFFLEWRAAFVSTVVEDVLMTNPNLSVNALRGLKNLVG